MEILETRIQKILTRTTGYLAEVTSHSAQPYRGCTLGSSLCGVGCYVQHSRHLLRGRAWGSFLEARVNAAESYREHVEAERRWARAARGEFSIFLSSATEPFLPQERHFGITRALLSAMLDAPPDLLVVQTHSHLILDRRDELLRLASRCRLRVHLSIETDRERLPGLPPHASPIARRFDAAHALKQAGFDVVITVSPLLPIADPDRFFATCAESAGAVVIDHFIEGDGTPDGRRTLATALPQAMAAVEPRSTAMAYREEMVDIARRYFPGRVGVGREGFAGRYT